MRFIMMMMPTMLLYCVSIIILPIIIITTTTTTTTSAFQSTVKPAQGISNCSWKQQQQHVNDCCSNLLIKKNIVKQHIPSSSSSSSSSSSLSSNVGGRRNVLLFMASTKNSKGFGKQTSSSSSSSTSNTSPITAAEDGEEAEQKVATTITSSSTTTTTTSSSSSSSLNAGQRALQELRRQKMEEKDRELRQVRELLQVEEMIQTKNKNNNDKDTSSSIMAIPEVVAQRMGFRMIPFVGIPFFGGMLSFIGFWYMATYQNIRYEPSLVAITTIALLLFGLLGITYSVMSASWDPDRIGSYIGWEEFQINLRNVQDGLRRSRSNAILRDKMASKSPQEIQKAIQDLNQREQQQQQKEK